MIDFILAGLIAGVGAFLFLFSLSFVILGLMTAAIRLMGAFYRHVVGDQSSAYREQPV